MMRPEGVGNVTVSRNNGIADDKKERITLDDGQQDDNDKEEEGDVEHDAIHLVGIAIRRFDFIANAASCTQSGVKMEDEALKEEKEGRR